MMNEKLDARMKNVQALAVGRSISESRVALLVYADEIDLDELTQKIGCEPTTALRKGEKDKNHPKRPAAQTGKWFLEAPRDLEFEQQVQYLFDRTTSDAVVWRNLISSHKIPLSCGIFLNSWNEVLSFSKQMISELAKRCWEVHFDIYSAEGDEIISAFLSKEPDSRETKH